MRAARLSGRLLVLAALASLLAVGLGRLVGLLNRERPVLFYSNRDGNGDLYILDAATGIVRNLTRHPASDTGAAWSPDGQRIAFSSHREGSANIYTMNAAGGDVRRITQSDAREVNPAWSPDGRLLAYASDQSGNWDLYVIPSSGGQPRQLTTHPGPDESPAWSPDGQQIAFVSRREGTWGVFLMATDGSNIRRLTDPTVRHITPTWSPDGTNLILASDSNYLDFELYRLDLITGAFTQLTDNRHMDASPAWTPSGFVLFESDRDGEPQIYRMAADGSGVQRLTFTAGANRDPN